MERDFYALLQLLLETVSYWSALAASGISLSSVCRGKALSLETIQYLDLIANVFHDSFQVLTLLCIKVRVPFHKGQSLGLV